MKHINDYYFWFLTGSQFLYGEDTLRSVALDSKHIVDGLNTSGALPCKLIQKETLVTSTLIEKTIMEASLDPYCAGVICWMHTFSPSKMWINGLRALNKPFLQINTQFNRKIPYDTMDMDFMNLNQSAHGDREFGYMTARMDIPRSVIVGYWEDERFKTKMSKWMRAAATSVAGRSMNIVRFGDNMRDVGVTCGDKVEAYIKLGWNVPYYGVGDLVDVMNGITEEQIDELMNEYQKDYDIKNANDFNINHIREQARIELAIEKFLVDNDGEAFTTNFQDLHGLKQLPGLAAQHLMAKGYGFAGEGDWKTAAMVRTLKLMGDGLTKGGCSFMEDYTYNLEEGKLFNLGAHMLEVCPSIAKGRPTIEVHPLGIGDKEDPARLVFNSKEGPGFTLSIIDLGGRLRLVYNDIQIIKPEAEFKKLPVARALWKPLPDFYTSTECWILSGGGHHNAMSSALDQDYITYYSEINNIELLAITKNTTVENFRFIDKMNRMAWK
ncbi:MAG: L-arabinose isomerase [Spirochaetaceae bacterium]|nr:L-arabinose isomerase [Spirochaetaceae bacterium]